MKFRFVISAIFALLSVVLLIEEGKEVKFNNFDNLTTEIFDHLKQPNASEALLFKKTSLQRLGTDFKEKTKMVSESNIDALFCLPLKAIFGNKSTLDLDQITDDLTEFFNRTFYAAHLPAMNFSQIDVNESFASRLKQFDRSIMKPLKSRNYYLVRNRFCLVLQLFYSARHLLDGLFEGGSYFFFVKNAFTFVQLRPATVQTLTVEFNDENSNFDCLTNYSKFECLKDCRSQTIDQQTGGPDKRLLGVGHYGAGEGRFSRTDSRSFAQQRRHPEREAEERAEDQVRELQ